MAYWLMKSEPAAFSWDMLVKKGWTAWDGVRNHQAANNLKAMRVGDRAFFYHSSEGLEIVGVMEVTRPAYPDPSDPSGRFVMVDVKPVMPVKRKVSLKEIKADKRFAELLLVKHTRLSVVPVSKEHWQLLSEMAGIKP
jgi:predicted RNA-binding protein with PUA-like domain